jgi:hypothetical protein
MFPLQRTGTHLVLHRYGRTGRDATPAVAVARRTVVRFVTVTHAACGRGASLHEFTAPRAPSGVRWERARLRLRRRRRREMRATRARGWFAWQRRLQRSGRHRRWQLPSGGRGRGRVRACSTAQQRLGWHLTPASSRDQWSVQAPPSGRTAFLRNPYRFLHETNEKRE